MEFTQTREQADKECILALLDRWRLATTVKHIEGILELVADDVVLLPSSRPPIKGKKELGKMYRTFFPRYREIKHEAIIEEIQIAGYWAFLWGTDELRLTPQSEEPAIHLKGKGLSILKRKSDGS
jgi:ketosteroid isomerase-like protein